MGNTSSLGKGGSDALEGVFGHGRKNAVCCSPVTVAEFSAVLSLALVTHDFARFADELEQAVQLLKGTATFSTAEAGLAIEIKFTFVQFRAHRDLRGSHIGGHIVYFCHVPVAERTLARRWREGGWR